MKQYIFLIFLVFTIQTKQTSYEILQQGYVETQDNNNIKIAFGSCNKFYRTQNADIFSNIQQKNPDIFVWLGDTAYLDIMYLPGSFIPDDDIDSINAKYRKTKQDKYYQELRSKTSIVGIWDDHDYGLNNSGINFQYKKQNQQAFLDFVDEPEDSPRRQQEGIYTSYYIGEDKKVKLIMVDNRYFLDNENQDMLGEVQWKWLENQLSDQQVELFILGSGVQVLPDDRAPAENWFVQSKERLYQLINKYSASVIFLSGDIHLAEILEHPCSKSIVGYQLHEITSSGLSLTFDGILPSLNQMTNIIFSNTYSNRQTRYFAENFGFIDIKLEYNSQKQIDYEKSKVIMSIYGKNNTENQQESIQALQKTISFQDLQKSQDNLNKDETSCIINQLTLGERIKKKFIDNIYEEIIIKKNVEIYGIIAYYLISIIILVKLYYFLLKVLFNKYNIKENKGQNKQKNN